jgi:tetratricopeptide (TPR) repeat protein
MPKRSKTTHNVFFMVSSIQSETIDRTTTILSLQAQQDYILRDFSKVREHSDKLRLISPKGETISEFFKALALSNIGDIVTADSIFEELTNSELAPLRAASLHALGLRHLHNNELEAAAKLISEAGSLALSGDICAPLTAIHAQCAMAYICGINGSSEQGIKLLETVEPLVKGVAQLFPVVLGQHFNALAYEHLQLGHVETASHLINKALGLSISVKYPDWSETADEIKARIPDRNKHYIPTLKSESLINNDEFQARRKRYDLIAEASIVPALNGHTMPYPFLAVYLSGNRFGVIPLPDDREIACLIMNTFLMSLEEITSRPEDLMTETLSCYLYTEVTQKHIGTEQIHPEHLLILESIIRDARLLEESLFYESIDKAISEEEVDRIMAYVMPMLEESKK